MKYGEGYVVGLLSRTGTHSDRTSTGLVLKCADSAHPRGHCLARCHHTLCICVTLSYLSRHFCEFFILKSLPLSPLIVLERPK